jgi:AcrR family transcriptional regulator
VVTGLADAGATEAGATGAASPIQAPSPTGKTRTSGMPSGQLRLVRPVQQDPGQQDPGQQDPGQQDPGQQDPGQQDPGQLDLGSQSRTSASSPEPNQPVTPQRVRIADAATRCVARKGVTKTTLDDVAREAGCSRATVYRTFPGGKEEVIAAVVDTEVARLFSAIAVAMGRADDLEDAIVAGIVATASAIGEHAALGYMLDNEPGVLLPHLCFAPMGRVIEGASRFASPFLVRWLDPEAALRLADWATRIVLSYLATPAVGVDLRNESSARRLVAAFVTPSARKLAREPRTDESRSLRVTKGKTT